MKLILIFPFTFCMIIQQLSNNISQIEVPSLHKLENKGKETIMAYNKTLSLFDYNYSYYFILFYFINFY